MDLHFSPHRRTAELHLFHYARLQVDEFPDAAVEVLEALLIHETVVFGLRVRRSSISSSLLLLLFPSHPQLELRNRTQCPFQEQTLPKFVPHGFQRSSYK